MKQGRLNLFWIDMKYVRNLAKVDGNVASVSPQIGKSTRPFLGVIVVCDEKEYCVPLSSPKAKHLKMKNDVDFMKIYDGERLIGVLNFNNMIPVTEQFISPVDMKIKSNDSPELRRYKSMLAKQLSWCQRNH